MNTNNINNVLGILAGLAAGAIILGTAGMFLYGGACSRISIRTWGQNMME